MVNEDIRLELIAMRREDLSVRQDLLESGQLGGAYVPQMEAIHHKNAARLRELIARHGWPAEDIAGRDGAEAAWLIVQHAIGEPEFQRHALRLMQASAAAGRTPAWPPPIWKTESPCMKGVHSDSDHSGSTIPATAAFAHGNSPIPNM